jgi:hypothetical protein
VKYSRALLPSWWRKSADNTGKVRAQDIQRVRVVLQQVCARSRCAYTHLVAQGVSDSRSQRVTRIKTPYARHVPLETFRTQGPFPPGNRKRSGTSRSGMQPSSRFATREFRRELTPRCPPTEPSASTAKATTRCRCRAMVVEDERVR